MFPIDFDVEMKFQKPDMASVHISIPSPPAPGLSGQVIFLGHHSLNHSSHSPLRYIEMRRFHGYFDAPKSPQN